MGYEVSLLGLDRISHFNTIERKLQKSRKVNYYIYDTS